MHRKKQNKGLLEWYILPVFCIFLLFWAGCAHGPWNQSDSGSSGGQITGATPQEGGSAATSGPLPKYYDFEDVPVPCELNLDKEESFIYQTTNFKAGVLVFSGRVDASSVVTFFATTLPRENWKLLGGFRYHRSILAFEKGSRICLVNVKESALKTHVEIYVAPRLGEVKNSTETELKK